MAATDLPLLVVQDAQVVQRRRVLRAGLQGALVAQLGLLHTPLDHVVCPCRQQAAAGCAGGRWGCTRAKQDKHMPVKGVQQVSPDQQCLAEAGAAPPRLVLGGCAQSLDAHRASPVEMCCAVLVTDSCRCAACEDLQEGWC